MTFMEHSVLYGRSDSHDSQIYFCIRLRPFCSACLLRKNLTKLQIGWM
jgi:hypothetical protein